MALPMEFWGVEVKAGQPLKVNPGDARILHLSQASLGESKNSKATDSVPVFVNFGGQKLVLGTLAPEKFPQLAFDLVFEKEFELSHNWQNGSVFFCGYTSVVQEEGNALKNLIFNKLREFHILGKLPDDLTRPTLYCPFLDSCRFLLGTDDLSEEENLPVNLENGKGAAETSAKPSTANANSAKPESSKPKVTIVEPMKVDGEDSDEDDDDEDEGSDDSEADSDEDDSEEEETPKKVEKGKKRIADSASKTPVFDKKAKLVTPQKTDGKKGGHTATPYPTKQAGKTPANAKQQTPKSDIKVTCKSCSKTFNSENALQAHSKAKHSAK